jgi:hypothetical protein
VTTLAKTTYALDQRPGHESPYVLDRNAIVPPELVIQVAKIRTTLSMDNAAERPDLVHTTLLTARRLLDATPDDTFIPERSAWTFSLL